MEYVLLVLSLIFLVVGFIGSFLPVLPGPPLSWVGLLLFYLVKGVEMDYWTLGITLFITVIVTILDYVIPSIGTKRFGGSKYGVWGTNIGLIVGLFIPPFGFIVGPFIGAFIGEIIFDSSNLKRALKAATGSFIGFLASTFLKIAVCLGFFVLFCIKVWEYSYIWF